MKFINWAIFPDNKNGNVVSTFHHQEIPRKNSICSVTAWPFLRSKSCLPFFLFFQGNTSRKFWTFQLFYFPVFWLQIPYAFAIIFMACHVMAFPTWTCELHCVVSGQRFRCVGLVQKISARCKKANNTVPCVFSFFFICAFILSIDQNSNILYHYLFPRTLLFITLFLKRMFFYLLFITNRTWN